MLKDLGCLEYSRWAALPKTERARWIAFYRLDAATQQYAGHRAELEKIDLSLEEWLQMTPDARKFKMESAKSAAGVGA